MYTVLRTKSQSKKLQPLPDNKLRPNYGLFPRKFGLGKFWALLTLSHGDSDGTGSVLTVNMVFGSHD